MYLSKNEGQYIVVVVVVRGTSTVILFVKCCNTFQVTLAATWVCFWAVA